MTSPAGVGSRPVCALTGLLILLSTSCGCQSWQKSHAVAINEFAAGNLAVSRSKLHESRDSRGAEIQLLTLDQAIIDLASGDAAASERQLREVRRELEHLTQKELTEQSMSVLTDDRATAFSGRSFEQQMALNMLLLSSLMNDGQDSFAYALQATAQVGERKTLLAEAARRQRSPGDVAVHAADPNVVTPVTYQSSATATSNTRLQPSDVDQTLALASYLAAAVQSESPTRYQETTQAVSDIGCWNAEFARRELATKPGEFGTRCQPGNGTLHVIALVGRAPEWVAESAMPTTAAMLIADRIISATGKHTLPPTISAVKISRPVTNPLNPAPGLLRCQVQGAANSTAATSQPTFHTLVNLDAVADAWYRENRDDEMARAVTRRVIKKGAIYVLKETQKVHRNTFVDLGVNVAGIAWEALEKPDTRSWRLLPARIEVARTELPAGTWTTSLNTGSARFGASAVTIPVDIENGRNTYVVCFLPGRQLTGRILVGGAGRGSFAVNDATSTKSVGF